VARSSALAPHRLAIIGVIVLLAALAFLFLRGPSFWQRYYYPLEHEQAIAEAAERHELNPYLIAAVIDAESDWEAGIISEAGAVGLMQVLPDTAEELERDGVVDVRVASADDLGDPEANIEFGAAYLRVLVERYHEVETALAAYNAGMGNADEWAAEGGDIRDAIDFPETRHYVLRVVRARDVYEDLYPDAFPEWEGSGE
jgi:soluble lytic murein transglycosylase